MSKKTAASLLLAALIPCSLAAAQCETQEFASFTSSPVDVMGWSVDMDQQYMAISYIGDDHACITDPNCNAGSVNMYERVGGVWTIRTRLQAFDAAARDEFGQDVDIFGDRIIVGAHFKGEGAAYVFVRNGTDWVHEQKLVGSTANTLDHFGHSVTMVGDTVVVGAMKDTTNGLNAGALYVFERSGGSWQETTKLFPSNPSAGERFGRATIARQDMIIGAALNDGAMGFQSGSVFVFERDDNGTPADPLDDTWPETQVLNPSNAAVDELFGRSLALDGDTLVIGASQGLVAGVQQGHVTIFERQGASWIEVQKIWASDGELTDNFGRSVAIHGDRMLVGSKFDDDGGVDAGAMYIFERAGGPWVETGKYIASNSTPGAVLGSEMGVALHGDQAVVGARFHSPGISLAGAAYAVDLAGCIGINYCAGNPNTTGFSGLMSASGSTMAANNQLELTATNMPVNQFGIFLVGTHSGFFSNPGGSQGNLCIGTSVGRYNRPGEILFSGLVGSYTLAINLLNTPSPSGPIAINPGDTMFFQLWHRDFIAGVGSVSNFTDGLEVEFH